MKSRVLALMSVCALLLVLSARVSGDKTQTQTSSRSTPDQIAVVADCGEPIAAPKYQVGDEWTWRDERGHEKTHKVIQVEGEITQIMWTNGDVAHYDKDRVIRKVVKRKGEILVKQGTGGYRTIGQKEFDFPLQVGREWEFSYSGRPAQGSYGLQTYYMHHKILACEEVVTPAGKFPALKIEVKHSSPELFAGSGVYYLWYAPMVKNSVKQQYVPSIWWSTGILDSELIKFEVK